MSELAKALPQVRNGLTLIAFLSLALLVAFKTNKVPELAFGLVRDKLTRAQFSALLHRMLVLGFAAFVISVALALVAQMLNQRTQPGALTIDDLRHELSTLTASAEQKIHAESQYLLAMEKAGQGDLATAVAALQESIKAVPSLTAQEMLTYLYRQQHDSANAAQAWEAAETTARQRGDKLALARLDNLGVPRGLAEPVGEHDLMGPSLPLPEGGSDYDSATPIQPGLFKCSAKDGCFGKWFRIDLKPGQQFVLRLRRHPNGGLAGAGLYGTNGSEVAWAGNRYDTMRGNAGPPGMIYETAYAIPAKGTYYFRTESDPGTVIRIRVDS